MAAMKWWGWGDDGIAFTDADKPALAPFIKEKIGLDVRRSTARPVPFDALAVPEPALPPVLRAALEEAVGSGSVSDDPLDRVVHGARQEPARPRAASGAASSGGCPTRSCGRDPRRRSRRCSPPRSRPTRS